MEMWLSDHRVLGLGPLDLDKISGIWQKHLDRVWKYRKQIKECVMGKKIMTYAQWKEFKEDVLVGVDVEFEHGTECECTNVTDDDLKKTMKIAMRHLAEGMFYYRLLIAFVEYYQEDILKAPKPNLCRPPEPKEKEELGSGVGMI